MRRKDEKSSEMGIVESVNKNLGGEKKKKMKTKTKMIASVEIAIVLCSLLLVALPAIAAEQNQEIQEVSATTITTASAYDFVLGVYGNANEDDTIDMRDLTYVKLIFFGKKPETELADAKYDGKINPLDFIQIKLIIVGKEKELTLVDSDGKIVTVKKPLDRVVAGTRGILELLRAVKLEKDRVVGVETWCQKGAYKIFFSGYQDKTVVGQRDPESILKLYPDLVLLISERSGTTSEVLEAAGITVFLAHGGVLGGDVGEEAIRFGYIFDKEKEAEELRDWYESITSLIKERVEKIPEEDKPKVYFESSSKYSITDESRTHVARTGGKDIFEGMTSGKVDAEAVVRRNPDIIVRNTWHLEGYDGYDMDAGDTAKIEEIRDEIMSRPELQIVTAVKEGRVYILSGYITSWGGYAGCRSFLQDAYMAKWFHPDIFKDVDPKAIHQDYLTRFQGLDIDLDEKGVFVYHPEEHPDGH